MAMEGRRGRGRWRWSAACQLTIRTSTITAGCVLVLVLVGLFPCWVHGDVQYYDFVLTEINVTKLCVTQSILVVNGRSPGPVIRVHKGDTVYINMTNQGNYGITLHWHGVKQPRNPWSDGPEFITQCPILPGSNFTYEVNFSEEEGTLWWHAHSDWTRATVHGAIVILPKEGTAFPFPKPDGEEIIVLGSWYTGDLNAEVNAALASGTDTPQSSGYLINGELGDFANCSSGTTYRWTVDYGKTYLLRIVNAVLNDELFFAIAEHNLTVVGLDAAYIKPIVTSYLMISPGQTMDVLLTTNMAPAHYYMASRQFLSETDVTPIYDIGSAIMEYTGDYNFSFSPLFPNNLPQILDLEAAMRFTSLLRSLADDAHPISVPMNITTRMFIVVSIGELCRNRTTCDTSEVSDNIIASSMNNISWANPTLDILEAYYRNISGYYTTDFPDWPSTMYNFTDYSEDPDVFMTGQWTKVKVLNYNESVEIVFQGTGLGAPGVHPMHLHGHSFYVIGMGHGNFNNETDPSTFNLVDPPKANTFIIPKVGWTAIRFLANNPGVWFWHCHFDRHMSRGMATVFIVKNGVSEETSLRRPPSNMPLCIGYNISTGKWIDIITSDPENQDYL